jgi:hypothetical protein
MSATAVSTADRDRMAAHLKRLGLYTTSVAIGSGGTKLTEGVAYVRDDLLPSIHAAIEKYEGVPRGRFGGWAYFALPNLRARRDELQAFLDEWCMYDLKREAL